MDLKNAVAVCLISLFSATLVAMIARTLDSQAAARIEPQLARIVEAIQAIRAQGEVLGASPTAAKGEIVDEGLMVYYFHGNTRCPTCQAIESQAHETVRSEFAAQLGRGEVAWKVVNYEQPAAAPLARKFEIQMPVVVLAHLQGGQVQDWKRLDKVWALVGDKPAFAAHVRDEIHHMLAEGKNTARRGSFPDGEPAFPAAAAAAVPPSAELPVPSPEPDLPVPE